MLIRKESVVSLSLCFLEVHLKQFLIPSVNFYEDLLLSSVRFIQKNLCSLNIQLITAESIKCL